MSEATRRLLGCERPLVAAPMAGGPSTPELVAAVAGAGGCGVLAGGYRDADGLAEQVAAVRAAGVTAFGVNLFVPTPVPVDADAYARYAARLAPDARRHGLEAPSETPPADDDDHWDAKLDLLRREPVPLVSFTFGIPAPEVIADLRRAGSTVLITVTTEDEARDAAAAGADGLVAQGATAGGHSGVHHPTLAAPTVGTADLTARVGAATGLPVVAAGGVAGPDDVRALLTAGAVAVAVGTLLLRRDEAGTSATHREALADPRLDRTVITHAFTGRPARALANDFVARHHAAAPLGYPALHHLTRPLRAAAARAGDPDLVHLWAGTGFRAARTGPAAALVDELLATSED